MCADGAVERREGAIACALRSAAAESRHFRGDDPPEAVALVGLGRRVHCGAHREGRGRTRSKERGSLPPSDDARSRQTIVTTRRARTLDGATGVALGCGNMGCFPSFR
jgi:hypothetical protein